MTAVGDWGGGSPSRGRGYVLGVAVDQDGSRRHAGSMVVIHQVAILEAERAPRRQQQLRRRQRQRQWQAGRSGNSGSR